MVTGGRSETFTKTLTVKRQRTNNATEEKSEHKNQRIPTCEKAAAEATTEQKMASFMVVVE